MNSEFTIAVHSLVFLAYRPDRMASSDMIAQNVNTHPSRVRKVMSSMRKEGYIVTKEGLGGGYILNCSPEEVTLAEIYRVTSIGSLQPSWCSGTMGVECMIACHMTEVMDSIFQDAEVQLLNHLNRTFISDVLEKIQTRQKQHSPAHLTEQSLG